MISDDNCLNREENNSFKIENVDTNVEQNKIKERKKIFFHRKKFSYKSDYSANKVHKKKREKKNDNNFITEILRNSDTKNAIVDYLNSKKTIYEKLMEMMSLNSKKWPNLNYLSGKFKREKFIDILLQEIEFVKKDNFNYPKYKEVLYKILGISLNKELSEIIVKNMYIAKMQNVIIILQSFDNNSELNDIQEEQNNSMYR